MPNEGEFRSYHLLLLMGTHGKYKYNSTEYRKALKVRSLETWLACLGACMEPSQWPTACLSL